MITDGWVLFALWETFYLIWAISALLTSQKTEHIKNFFLQLLGIFIIIPFTSVAIWVERSQFPEYSVLFKSSLIIILIGFIFTIVGLAFAVWARIKLGRNWSGSVKILPNHKLIRDGPFKIVRHPIYLGTLFGTLGTAIILGDIIVWVIFIISVFTLVSKSREEEILLLKQFGSEYEQYKKDVKMLIPFLL